MNTSRPFQSRSPRRPFGRRGAFTIVELVVAIGITLLLVAGTSTFLVMASRSMSGTVSQTSLNMDAVRASDFMFNRIRLAVFVTNDISGHQLTLAFDDDRTLDSDGDGKSYNDRNHYESFEFRSGDATDSTVTDNQLIYRANTNSPMYSLLVDTGVRVLPKTKFFVVTNIATVLVNFGLLDPYTPDNYQSCDIQGAMVSRNRLASKATVNVLP